MAEMESDHQRAVYKKARYRQVLSKIYVRAILTVIALTICPALIYYFFKTDAVGQIGGFGWVVLAGIILFMLTILSLGLQGVGGIAFRWMFRDAGDDEPEGDDWDPKVKAQKESEQIRREKAARKRKG